MALKPCRACRGPKEAGQRLYCLHCEERRAKKKERAEKAWARRIEKTYAITPAEYHQVKAAQGGTCALCRRANGATKRLAVDHDHALEVDGRATRESIRGLACGPCNQIIGRFGDDPEAFERIAHYLRQPPAREVLGT